MPFEKGDERINRSGRPEGAKNRVNDEIRTRINEYLSENFDEVLNDLKTMEARERVRFYIELLQYSVPKLKAMELKTENEDLRLTPPTFIFKNLNEKNDENE
jgi:hypothetical protein